MDWKLNKARNRVAKAKSVTVIWYSKNIAENRNLTNKAKTTALDAEMKNRLVDKKIK